MMFGYRYVMQRSAVEESSIENLINIDSSADWAFPLFSGINGESHSNKVTESKSQTVKFSFEIVLRLLIDRATTHS